MHEEVCTIVVAGVGNQHERVGTSHRYVLCRVEPDGVSLVELGIVPRAVSAAEPVSAPLSGAEPMSKSLLALLAVRLGCDVVQFRELHHHNGPRRDGDCRNFRAVFCPGQLQQLVQLQPKRQSVAVGRPVDPGDPSKGHGNAVGVSFGLARIGPVRDFCSIRHRFVDCRSLASRPASVGRDASFFVSPHLFRPALLILFPSHAPSR